MCEQVFGASGECAGQAAYSGRVSKTAQGRQRQLSESPGPNPRNASEASMIIAPQPCLENGGAR